VLSTRIVCRLRALILLPTRDLAWQVHSVLEPFCTALGLRAVVATGQQAFTDEQTALVGTAPNPTFKGGTSLADILVCTPGRLMDHLQSTPGFTLQHLEFLVIDEADRLLNQSYSDWAYHILQAAHQPPKGGFHADLMRGTIVDAVAIHSSSPLALPHQSRFQTLLFSATLTRNPQKLGSLQLRNPLFLTSASGKKHYKIPDGLMVRCARARARVCVCVCVCV
jgi:ATP-dependent RNA helicase DDX51/DBP6